MVRCESRAHNGESLIIRNPSMRLLIVEDDAPLASGLSRILEAEGHAVDVTERGEDAVLAASQEHFDLVILDIGLPRMDGYEVLRRLRAAEKPIPVLVLTARDAVEGPGARPGHRRRRLHGEALRDAGAHGAACARSCGARRRTAARASCTARSRSIPWRAAPSSKNEPLELAAREWAVLEVLLAKVEKIVSKEAIIQAVAGWGEDLSPNAIEVYVSRLRSKLEPAGIKIRTVRGFGYMLEEFKAAPH
jgi:two-component system OmpR family response regulator